MWWVDSTATGSKIFLGKFCLEVDDGKNIRGLNFKQTYDPKEDGKK